VDGTGRALAWFMGMLVHLFRDEARVRAPKPALLVMVAWMGALRPVLGT